jgi:hypothetical protein
MSLPLLNLVKLVNLVKASTTEHPADKVAWTLAYKTDLEQKGYDDDQSDAFTQMQRGSVTRSQSARLSQGSSGSQFSLETTGSRSGRGPRPLSKDGIQPSIAQPIVANISLPQITGNNTLKRKSQASTIKLSHPPGLDAPPPRKPLGALLSTPSLVIPTSRWSATTVASSLPSTPAPVSATGVTMNGARRSKAQQGVNETSRWSVSTTTTTATMTTSSSRADEPLPPVPELPRLPPSAQGAEAPSVNRRNVI